MLAVLPNLKNFLNQASSRRMFYSENKPKCFPSTLHWRNLKTEQSSVLLDLCLRNRLGQVNERDTIVFEKPRFFECGFYSSTQKRKTLFFEKKLFPQDIFEQEKYLLFYINFRGDALLISCLRRNL